MIFQTWRTANKQWSKDFVKSTQNFSILKNFLLYRRENLLGISTKRRKRRRECGELKKKEELVPKVDWLCSFCRQTLWANAKSIHASGLTLVPCEKELTLENIKDACKTYFNTELECDVLAGDCGHSYTNSGRNPELEGFTHAHWKSWTPHKLEQTAKPQNEPAGRGPSKSYSQNPPLRQTSDCVRPSPSVMRSVSLSQMMKLGRVIVPDTNVVSLQLEEFCISRMEWLEPFEVTLSLERKPFANGAFCEAFLAKSISGLPKGKYVLKKYLEGEKPGRDTVWIHRTPYTKIGLTKCSST